MLQFLDWSVLHKRIVLPILLLILIGLLFSLFFTAKQLIQSQAFKALFYDITGKQCSFCGKANSPHINKSPAKIPKYFYQEENEQ